MKENSEKATFVYFFVVELLREKICFCVSELHRREKNAIVNFSVCEIDVVVK